MQYGQLLDSEYSPYKEEIYNSFADYFENPMMTKIKDVDNYSMYLCKIHCLLSTTNRYLIIFINKDKSKIGSSDSLRYLQWNSLQTRSIEDNHNVSKHKYTPRNTKELSKKINIKKRHTDHSTYDCETYPLNITLLHVKKDSLFEYNKSGTIVTAIETYNTIISFN